MVTPFDRNGNVDTEQMIRLANHLLDEGCDALLLTGTTGESPTLSRDEKRTIYEKLVEAVGDRCFIWAGTGNNNTAESIELTREAEQIGVDGIMLITPYYNKPSQEGLYRHFSQVAEVTRLPIMLYNVPGRTSVNLLPATVARLTQNYENIVALKEANGNLDQLSELKQLVDDSFTVYSGEDSLTLPMLSLGARGVVSVAAHVVAPELRRMVDAVQAEQMAIARQIHNKIYPLCKALFITTNPVPVKQALEWRGWSMGGYRAPLAEMSSSEADELRRVLSAYESTNER